MSYIEKLNKKQLFNNKKYYKNRLRRFKAIMIQYKKII